MKKPTQTSRDHYNTNSISNMQDQGEFNNHSSSEERKSVHKTDSLKGISTASLQLTSECVSAGSESNRYVECPEVFFERSIRSSREQSDLHKTLSYSISNHLSVNKNVLQVKGITKTGSKDSIANKQLPNSTSYTIPGTFSHEHYTKSDELFHSLPPGSQLGARASVHQLLHHEKAHTNPSVISSSLKETNLSTDDFDYLLKPPGMPLKTQALVYVQQNKHSNQSKHLNQPPHQEESSSAASSSGTRHPVTSGSQLKDDSSVGSSHAQLISGNRLVSAVASVHQLQVSQLRNRPLRNRSPQTQDHLPDLPLSESPQEIQRQPHVRVRHKPEQKKYQKEHPSPLQRQHKTRSQMRSESSAQREHDSQRVSGSSAAQNKEITRKSRLSGETLGNEQVMESLATEENTPGVRGRPRHEGQFRYRQQHEMQVELSNRPLRPTTRSGPHTQSVSKTQEAPNSEGREQNMQQGNQPHVKRRDIQRNKHQSQPQGEIQVAAPNQTQSQIRLEPQAHLANQTQVAPQTTKRDKQRKKHENQPQGEMQESTPNQIQSEVRLEHQAHLPNETQVLPQTTKRVKQRKKHENQPQGEMQVATPNQTQMEVRLKPQAHLPSETQVAPPTQSQGELQVIEQQSQLQNQSEESILQRPRQSVSNQFDPIVTANDNDQSAVRSTSQSTRLSLASSPTSARRTYVHYSSRELSRGSEDHIPAPEVHNDLSDPWQHAKLLSNCEAWVHVIKGILGAGVLFIPFCFAHAGIVAGILVLCGSSVICYAGHYVIIRRGQEFRQQETEWVGYAGVVKFAFMRGPWKFRQSASCFESVTYMLIVTHGMMLGYIYVVIVSSIISDIILKYWMDVSFAQSTLFSLGLILPLNLIPTLKYLSTYVLLGNCIFLSGIIILMYYLIANPIPQLSSTKVAGHLQGVTVLFSNALFAAQAVPLIVSVQSCMLITESLINRFQVLELVTVLVTALFLSLGVLGHLKYGDEVNAIIIFNLPQDSLAYYCKAAFALSICFSHALLIYPVYEFVWEKYLKKSFINSKLSNMRMGAIILRVALTLLTVVPAFFIVSPAKYCLVFVAMITTVLVIIFPALIEICIRWESRRDETFWATRVILFLEILVALLGVYIFVFGTFWLVDVIRKYTR